MKAITDSLICQRLKDGTMFGGDYDGRLGPLTDWINRCSHLFKDKTILDLGSNAGHFPIEYMRAGARKVIAVEGRPEFETQWHGFKNLVHHVNLEPVDWITADVRLIDETGYSPNYYNVISCLGLLYHLSDYLPKLKELSKCADLMLIELDTPVTGDIFFKRENPADRTCGLEREERMKYPSHHDWEVNFIDYFQDDFSVSRVWLYIMGRVVSLIKGEKVGYGFNLCARAFYAFCRKPMEMNFSIDPETGCTDINHQKIMVVE